ncbi:NAD(P)H-dependent oxidoreductase [Nitrososphaera sp.]|uniref:NADPH-dependent FMN reductase n=1 Tax=Nitrososphaera sp. TaxID=1971748 RepID=UPI0017B7EF19|nr:NAD(P)H-dependent oxidoreductase [Nitrososphaera sp.]NWG36620.1 NAD(P)H-dependent oxidoreductase [Nitrososphaera sp.]
MTGELKVLGVAGSMRENSYSLKVLRMALEEAQKRGAQTRLLALREADLPMYAPNASSPALEKVTKEVEWADAFILASPDYHGSMSGLLKNFLDHFYEEFAGKLFGYVVASHEKGLTVMDQMRTAVRQCYGWSLPYGVSISGVQDFTDGRLTNEHIEKRIRTMARDLVVYGNMIKTQFAQDLAGAEEETFAARYRQA